MSKTQLGKVYQSCQVVIWNQLPLISQNLTRGCKVTHSNRCLISTGKVKFLDDFQLVFNVTNRLV